MGVYKAVKIELHILTHVGHDNEEIIAWLEDACIDYCQFDEAIAHIKETHEPVVSVPTSDSAS